MRSCFSATNILWPLFGRKEENFDKSSYLTGKALYISISTVALFLYCIWGNNKDLIFNDVTKQEIKQKRPKQIFRRRFQVIPP
jgi:hypothetical protein